MNISERLDFLKQQSNLIKLESKLLNNYHKIELKIHEKFPNYSFCIRNSPYINSIEPYLKIDYFIDERIIFKVKHVYPTSDKTLNYKKVIPLNVVFNNDLVTEFNYPVNFQLVQQDFIIQYNNFHQLFYDIVLRKPKSIHFEDLVKKYRITNPHFVKTYYDTQQYNMVKLISAISKRNLYQDIFSDNCCFFGYESEVRREFNLRIFK